LLHYPYSNTAVEQSHAPQLVTITRTLRVNLAQKLVAVLKMGSQGTPIFRLPLGTHGNAAAGDDAHKTHVRQPIRQLAQLLLDPPRAIGAIVITVDPSPAILRRYSGDLRNASTPKSAAFRGVAEAGGARERAEKSLEETGSN
ncbi:hypothetical protein VOLCADRAFT_86824, partial [Volvox carteri f. nagariensis]